VKGAGKEEDQGGGPIKSSLSVIAKRGKGRTGEGRGKMLETAVGKGKAESSKERRSDSAKFARGKRGKGGKK